MQSDEKQVTVADMMAARDARAARQRDWTLRYGAPLVSLTMNIAGPVKQTPRIDAGFAEAVRRVTAQLHRYGMDALADEARHACTGPEALWAVAADAYALKRRMAAIEMDGPFGRLLDIDVIAPDGEKVGREAVGLPKRRCLLCGAEAASCARARTHSADALFAKADGILRDTLDGMLADRVAGQAERALLVEVAVTPKPGLVDRANSGAHLDMDFFTFVSSASALRPFLRECVLAGLRAQAEEALFASLRYAGMRAEEAMLAATGGVNTHKGAIFLMGLLCAAAGWLGQQGESAAPDALFAAAARLCRDALRAEMAALNGPQGARGEAAAGFPSVRVVGLPALRGRLAAGDSLNDAAAYALVALMAHVQDANVIRRGGEDRARRLRAESKALLDAFSLPKAQALDAKLIREGISPGGCADLLAVTLLAHFLSASA